MEFETGYSLALLGEYTHTLDSLPLELSRNFADLRELDAVLSSSMASVSAKIQSLTGMIEGGTASKEERLWLLTEIADEANKLKLGSEDKIRVACQAADNLRSHSNHLRTMANLIPGFDVSVLRQPTIYPHVAARQYMPVGTHESGRRRKPAAYGSLLNVSAVDPSPVKRKRVVRDEDDARTPQKQKVSDGRQRNGARKKVERAASPADSIYSINSHMQHHPSTSRAGASHSRTNGVSSTNSKRGTAARGGTSSSHHPNAAHRTPSIQPQYEYTYDAQPHLQNGSSASRRNGGAGHDMLVPPASGHPSLPMPYQNGTGRAGSVAYEHIHASAEWSINGHQGLEGPGMPKGGRAGSAATSVVIQDHIIAPADDMDVEDDKKYCFCNGVSFGEMIACDGKNCEREWFHIQCVNLTELPDGEWFCDACIAKQSGKAAKRGGARGGKRKAANRGTARGTG